MPSSRIESFPSLTPPRTRLGLEAARSETIASPLTMSARPSNAAIEMPSVHSMFLFECGFDEFLCASIVEEKNGMALSVMSAFARRNVDPGRKRRGCRSCGGTSRPGNCAR
jgi:hypothetical protein